MRSGFHFRTEATTYKIYKNKSMQNVLDLL